MRRRRRPSACAGPYERDPNRLLLAKGPLPKAMRRVMNRRRTRFSPPAYRGALACPMRTANPRMTPLALAQNTTPRKGLCSLAERVGFEPRVRLHVRLISSQVRSTTLPPLRFVRIAGLASGSRRCAVEAASPRRGRWRGPRIIRSGDAAHNRTGPTALRGGATAAPALASPPPRRHAMDGIAAGLRTGARSAGKSADATRISALRVDPPREFGHHSRRPGASTTKTLTMPMPTWACGSWPTAWADTKHGEVASAIARDMLITEVGKGALAQAIQLADEEIIRHSSRKAEALPMGTTVVAVRIKGIEVRDVLGRRQPRTCGTVGSAARGTTPTCRNRSNGAPSPPNRRRTHPHRNVVTQALGETDPQSLRVDTVRGTIKPGTQILLCSDGLTEEGGDSQIAAALCAHRPGRAECVDHLIPGRPRWRWIGQRHHSADPRSGSHTRRGAMIIAQRLGALYSSATEIIAGTAEADLLGNFQATGRR